MRITGGTLRSRVLKAPRGLATRPTTDRVREALFSILASRGGLVALGGRVLDLYAGTGALGLEALSRGARHATFVERDKAALAALRANVRELGLEARATVLPVAVDRALARAAGPFDLVFADPPWDDVTSTVPAALGALAASVAEGALVVLEHRAGDVAPEIPGLALASSRRYGDTELAFYDPSPGA